jgi:tRNA threonylcarbamoyladenosine biosynthesis protein TsaE
MFDKSIITKNFEETRELGEKIIQKLNDTNILALYGNLGSGKTTFVQGLAKGLGIDQKIISPTFIIVRKYELSIKNKELRLKNFYHIDLYRIENEGDIKGLGLEEILDDKTNIVAIEWPEKIENILPNKIMRLYFEYLGNNKREIKIK